MIVAVHGIWIFLRYFVRAVSLRDTADKAVQVGGQSRHFSTTRFADLKCFPEEQFRHNHTSGSNSVGVSGRVEKDCRRKKRGKKDPPNQQICSKSRNSSHSKIKKMAEASTSFSEIRKKAPTTLSNTLTTTSTWLENAMKRPAETPTNQMRDLLDNLEQTWFDGRNATKSMIANRVSELVNLQFESGSNPFSLCLYLVERCRDFYTAKTTTLAFFIMKEFERWSRHTKKELDQFLTREIRFHAFLMSTEHHMTMFDMVVKAFKMKHDGNEYFLPEVRKFLEKGKHKEACHCAGKLGLQHHFKMEEIILPLILQDKVNLVETYVIGNPEQQMQVVQLLDHLCDRGTNINKIIETSGLDNVKRDKLQKKTLSKLAVRLMKLYQIPAEHCPNISNARGFGALKYLMYKKYIEKTFGSGSWDEMVKNAVGDSDYLKEQLVEQLMCYNDLSEAVRWVKEYDLPDSKIPMAVQEAKARMAVEDPSGAAASWDNGSGENWDDDCTSDADVQKHYHNLCIPAEQITLVDTRDKLTACVHRLTQTGSVIGIDSEWRPAFAAEAQRVALMQFAVHDQVFLVDCVSLRSCLNDDDWAIFIRSIFCSSDTVKLGYGLESDLSMLTKTFPSMKDAFMSMKRVVNVEEFSKQIFGSGPVQLDESSFLSDEEDGGAEQSPWKRSRRKEDNDAAFTSKTYSFTKKEERGLSELVRQCLGKPLCKMEQMSDWEKRPLRQAQVLYAALDAYVLLEVYDALKSHVQKLNLGIDLEPPVRARLSRLSKTDKKKAKAAGKQPMPEASAPPPSARSSTVIAPAQLRVVADTMLQGLGKHLRSCGVDVKILESSDDHEKAIMLCQQEDRIVLTSGSPFQMICARVGHGRCYNVMKNKAAEQATEVLAFFNVKVTRGDIFSRCQVCNSDDYLQIPVSDMKLLYEQKRRLEECMARNEVAVTSNDVVISSRFISEYGIDWMTGRLATSGAQIKLDVIHGSKFETVDWFYCCANCGKVFWEGSHFAHVCEQFSHVLSVDDNRTVYNST